MKWQNRGHEFDGLGAYFQEHADIYIYTDEGYAHTLAAALTFLKREIRLIDPSVNQAEGSRVPLREVLGRKVEVRRSAKGGVLEIEFYSKEDLTQLAGRIVGMSPEG